MFLKKIILKDDLKSYHRSLLVIIGIFITEENYQIAVAKRITVMLDDDLIKKLREIQAKQIRETQKAISFSKVLNEYLEMGMKKK